MTTTTRPAHLPSNADVETWNALGYLCPGIGDDSEDTVQVNSDYFTLNTRRWLADRLTFDALGTAAFEDWRAEHHEADPWGDIARYGFHAARTYVEDVLGVPSHTVSEHNSYNGETYLEDVIQWVQWDDPETDEHKVLLQVHLGGDVRGGYSDPVMFTTSYGFGHDIDTAEAACSWEPATHGDPLPGLSGYEADRHYFTMSPWDSYDHDGASVTIPTDVETEDGEYVIACPTCLDAGRVSKLDFSLPYPTD